MTETLTAALDYAERGLRVLPIMPGGKGNALLASVSTRSGKVRSTVMPV